MRAIAISLALAWCAVSNPVLGATPATAVEIPALTGPVVDTAGVVDAAANRAITALAEELADSTGAEIALLTVRSTAPLTAFDYGMQVVEAWKLGRSGIDDGLLLLIAVDDREVRFFQGYGLEGVLPDGHLGVILDRDVLPALRDNAYGTAALAGLRSAAFIISEAYASGAIDSRPVSQHDTGFGRRDVVSLLLLLFVLIVIGVVVAEASSIRHHRHSRPVFWDGFPRGFGSGGFGRGGFGGGGFGGGGRFGGGGAGRRW